MKSIANPFNPCRLGDFLIQGLESDATGFRGASAFARRSGIVHLDSAIRSFSAARPFRLVVGIDLHGTSVEALELLLSCGGPKARIYVFHNPAASFHPKTYRLEYADRWEAYGGSGNLTSGGLFGNYEFGFAAILPKADPEAVEHNARLTAEFNRWFNVRSGNAKALTPALIKALRDRRLILPETRILDVRAAAAAQAGAARRRPPLFPARPVPGAPPFPGAAPADSSGARIRRRRRAAGAKSRLTEAATWPLMLAIAAGMPGRRATTQECIDRIPGLYDLSDADLKRSNTRAKQPRWHQIVRNVISHRREARGPFKQGLAHRTTDGVAVTGSGVEWLRAVGLVP